MNEAYPKYELLIVDDEPVNIKTLAEAFRTTYRVRFATNGQDALRIATGEAPPDLILLDIHMPGLDGYEVCRELKRQPTTQAIPVIFLSARNQAEDEARGLELGAVDYIIKPFNLPIVQARVQTQIQLKSQRDMLEELSVIDGLTGIPNRRYLDQFLDLEWRRCVRRQSPLSVIVLDLDLFRRFNERYSQLAGDACLQQIAKVLASSARRPAEFVARFGGEEFVAVLPESEPETTEQLAELMRRRVEALDIHHGPSVLKMTVSVGAATMIPQRHSMPKVLLEVADRLMLEAKGAGRNCCKVLDLT